MKVQARTKEQLAAELAQLRECIAELMQRQPAKWGKYLDVLAQEMDRLARVVQDILEISRIDAGRVEMEPRPAAVNEFSAAVFASDHAPARERGLTLEHRPAEPGPAALVHSRRLTQVLNELVENAILFTSRGGTVVICTGTQETVCTI